MNRIQKTALAVSSAALCMSAASGCAALRDAPISNAKANENPAIPRSNTYAETGGRAPVKADVVPKKAPQPSKAPPEEVTKTQEAAPSEAPKKQPATKAPTRTSDAPAWVTVVNWADSKRGHKYVWGGESDEEGGFDCSGLMLAAYAQAGIKLPRVANDQYATTSNHPEEKDLRMGDLVFFGETARGIHHVGLYVGRDGDGNAMMLHAPNSRSVIRFDKVHYMKDYYGATRVIP